MEAVGGAQLQSVFPPPVRTLVGAIRTAIGEAHQVDWRAYGTDASHPLRAVMGDSQGLGPLRFVGPVLTLSDKRLFPMPLALLAAQNNGTSERKFARLVPSTTVSNCDIGRVRLPIKKTPLDGAKPLEGKWLTTAGMKQFLSGTVPQDRDVVSANELFHDEDRLGIGRNVRTGSVEEGLLYQTCHVRPSADVRVGMLVAGLNAPALPSQGMARLGAEGRMATWSRAEFADSPAPGGTSQRLLVVLLTHARFANGWVPDGFEAATAADRSTVWEGTLQGVRLRLICAVVGKSVREGGWDMVAHAPRAMDSLVPAGSCYFFECVEGAVELSRLSGSQMGQDTVLGRGEVAVGVW